MRIIVRKFKVNKAIPMLALLMAMPTTIHAVDKDVGVNAENEEVTIQAIDHNIGTGGNSGASSALLNVAPSQLNVTVPMSLPINVATDGTVTTATEAKIVNNSIGRVKVTDVAVTGANNWLIIDYESDMSSYKVNEKKLGFMLNGGKTIGGGLSFEEMQYPTLAAKNDTDTDELLLDYDAVITPQSNAVVDQEVARVAFTVDWDSAENSPTGIHMTTQEATDFGYTYELLADDTVKLTKIPLTVEHIEFPTTIDNKVVTELAFKDAGGAYPFLSNTTLKSVVIPNSVTTIGERAFMSSQNLTSVNIGHGVTTIGKSAFTLCTNLKFLKIPNNVKTIGSSAFEGSGLTSIVLGNGITSIERSTFMRCNLLTSIVIPNGVESIGISAFEKCTSLASVVFPASLKSVQNQAFYECIGLTSVTIPDTVVSIKTMAFYKVNRIFYTGTAGGAPWGASSINLDSMEIDGDFSYGLKNNTYTLLKYSGNQTNVVIPSEYKGKPVDKIGGHAFANSSITSVTIPESIKTIGTSAFEGSSLTSIVIPDSVTELGNDIFYNCASLTSVTIGNGIKNIPFQGFEKCISLTSITIPSNVTSISNRAFADCSGFTSLAIPSTVTRIDSYAFEKVKSITYTGTATGSPWGALKHDIPIEFVELNDSMLQFQSVPSGTTKTLQASYFPLNTTDDKTITWTSSNPDIASVDANGIVTGWFNGSATITVTVAGKSATCEVICHGMYGRL